MERSNVLRFPSPEERRERAKEQNPAPELDAAKVIGVRRIINEERDSTPPYLWGDRKLKEKRDELLSFPLFDLIRDVNDSREQDVRRDPIRFHLMLEIIESCLPTSQDDE